MRFGVDAFSANTLRLQKKGYTPAIASQNLKDCWEAGIYTEVNWVIGVPGETTADVEEGVALILENQRYIGRLANINPLILVNGSVYWIDPEAHNIVLRRPKEELYAQFPRALPADLWYSTHPYIDAAVRRQYFERIVLSLYDSGFPVGAWANRIIDDVKSGRDRHRAGSMEQGRPLDDGPSLGAGDTAPVRPVRSLLGYDLFAYNGRFYGVPQGRENIDFAALEVAPPADVAVGLTEASAAGWIERITGELQTPFAAIGSGAAPSTQPVAVDEPDDEPVDDGTPRLIRVVGTTNIVRHAGRYYAFPQAFGPVDLTRADQLPNGILSAATLGELQAEMDYAARWANARGILDSQEAQRRRGTIFRVDSALGEPGASVLESGNLIVHSGGEIYSISRQALSAVGLAQSQKQAANVEILFAVSKGATPELIRSFGRYNVVSYDGLFYAIPQGLDVPWGEEDVAVMPGVVTAASLNEVLAAIGCVRAPRPRAGTLDQQSDHSTGMPVEPVGSGATPRLLGEQQGYNIVEYEGWIYGIPQDLGPLDLTEMDVIGMPGVIRDLSISVVEDEIVERRMIGNAELAAAE